MQVKVRPVLIVGREGGFTTRVMPWHVYPQTNGQLEVTTDAETSRARIESLHQEVMAKVKSDVVFLDSALVQEEGDLIALRKDTCEADAFLVYLPGSISHGALETLFWDLPIPIIVFSGEYTPMMGLYYLPVEEREHHPNVTFALDTREIQYQMRLLGVKKRLRNSKIILLGAHQRETSFWQFLPEPEITRRKLGVEFIPLSGAQFVAEVDQIEEAKAEAIAQQWMASAKEVAEPSPDEVREAAAMYLALGAVLKRTGAQAVSAGCLELMYAFNRRPFCFALAMLRDEGIPAGCEGDATATLTMLILDYIANRPAYMGNLVRVEPKENLLMISHGCSPSKMAGREQPAKPYTLVRSHSYPPFTRVIDGGAGLTSYVEYDIGQEVTITRIGANLDRMPAAKGEIIDCRDTICDRTAITVRVKDAREFFHHATGNHQVVVYGNYLRELRGLCQLLNMNFLEI